MGTISPSLARENSETKSNWWKAFKEKKKKKKDLKAGSEIEESQSESTAFDALAGGKVAISSPGKGVRSVTTVGSSNLPVTVSSGGVPVSASVSQSTPSYNLPVGSERAPASISPSSKDSDTRRPSTDKSQLVAKSKSPKGSQGDLGAQTSAPDLISRRVVTPPLLQQIEVISPSRESRATQKEEDGNLFNILPFFEGDFEEGLSLGGGQSSMRTKRQQNKASQQVLPAGYCYQGGGTDTEWFFEKLEEAYSLEDSKEEIEYLKRDSTRSWEEKKKNWFLAPKETPPASPAVSRQNNTSSIGSEAPTPAQDDRGALMQQIRDGVQLKKASARNIPEYGSSNIMNSLSKNIPLASDQDLKNAVAERRKMMGESDHNWD